VSYKDGPIKSKGFELNGTHQLSDRNVPVKCGVKES